jgi:hypothetical protein
MQGHRTAQSATWMAWTALESTQRVDAINMALALPYADKDAMVFISSL